MIIVSQNKRKIFNFNNISIIQIMDNNEIWVDTEKTCNNLGTYKTEERAKKVLQEIYICKAIFEFYKSNPTNEELLEEMANNFDKDNILFDIYEMPEE